MRKWFTYAFLPTVIAILLAFCFKAHAQAATGFSKIGTSTTTTFTDTTCPLLVGCLYQVVAVDSAGIESQPSSCSSTALCVSGNQAVALMPSSGTHTVGLSWTGSTSNGVTYNIYRHIGPLPPSNLNAVVN